MPVRIKDEQGLAAGLVIVAVSLAGLTASLQYHVGTALRMGPGFFPALVFGALGIVGIIILARAFTARGDRLQSWALRPLAFVVLSLLVFAISADRLGFVVSGALLVAIASFARPKPSLVGTTVLAISLVTFCVLVFLIGLGLPIPLWPEFQ